MLEAGSRLAPGCGTRPGPGRLCTASCAQEPRGGGATSSRRAGAEAPPPPRSGASAPRGGAWETESERHEARRLLGGAVSGARLLLRRLSGRRADTASIDAAASSHRKWPITTGPAGEVSPGLGTQVSDASCPPNTQPLLCPLRDCGSLAAP